MTYQARVTDEGELVLPADLARALGLRPGDDIEVEPDGSANSLRLRHAGSRAGDEVDRFIAERANDWGE